MDTAELRRRMTEANNNADRFSAAQYRTIKATLTRQFGRDPGKLLIETRDCTELGDAADAWKYWAAEATRYASTLGAVLLTEMSVPHGH